MIRDLIRHELTFTRNADLHAERLERKINKELEKIWTDIALKANECGLRGDGWETFARYGYERIGGEVDKKEIELREFYRNAF